MKNVFFALAFMLVGTFAFANSEVTSDVEVNKTENALANDVQEELLGCTSTTVTTTTTNTDGSSTSTSTTTVTCDTPQELAQYQAAIKQLGLRE
ncbi:hypothetical protein [Flavobacterium sp.]|uniref:hypothetical protein n=1 Tax=Flavobacterium sp. TaxID=239 RepID=UPI00404739DA